MSNRNKFNKPLMYISQPITKYPNVIMQSHYTIRTKTKEEVEPIAIEPSDTLPIKANSQQDEIDKSTNPFDTKRRKSYTFQRVKNFKEMTIDEKLDYLEHFPEQLPPVSCIYKTTTTIYSGILVDNTKDVIEVTLPDRTNVKIHKTDLEEISMIGFG